MPAVSPLLYSPKCLICGGGGGRDVEELFVFAWVTKPEVFAAKPSSAAIQIYPNV